jgi:hypothetical protein
MNLINILKSKTCHKGKIEDGIPLGDFKTDQTIDSEFELNEFYIEDETRSKLKYLVKMKAKKSILNTNI